MKLNNNLKKKTFTELDDQFDGYEDAEKWYEQVRPFFLTRINMQFGTCKCVKK